MNSPVVYPSLKDAADQASANAQRNFLYLNVVLLAVLTSTALISGYTPTFPGRQRLVAVVVAVYDLEIARLRCEKRIEHNVHPLAKLQAA